MVSAASPAFALFLGGDLDDLQHLMSGLVDAVYVFQGECLQVVGMLFNIFAEQRTEAAKGPERRSEVMFQAQNAIIFVTFEGQKCVFQAHIDTPEVHRDGRRSRSHYPQRYSLNSHQYSRPNSS